MNKNQAISMENAYNASLRVIRESRSQSTCKQNGVIEFNWDPEETCECGKSIKYCKYPRCSSGNG